MSLIRFAAAVFLILITGSLQAQQTISEGTIVYDISIQTGAKEPQMADALDGATTTVYLRGTSSRTDMVSALGSEKTIYDAKSGTAVILKEYSGQKLMITLTKENWETKNKKYKDIVFTPEDETKIIMGHPCIKANAVLKDGTTFIVYYAKDLTVMNKDYDQTFKSLPGLAMQFEFKNGKTRFSYTVSKIDINPIPASKFDFPKTGYRVMTYDENKLGKKDKY
jgi:GLPGLI family protein